jgi:nicotinamidase-related amidase
MERGVDVIIVVDMQVGLLAGPPKHDLDGVRGRINALAAMVRAGGGKVIWIKHRGRKDDAFAPHSAGSNLLPELVQVAGDLTVEKTLNDPYVGTPLRQILAELAPRRVIVTGWATDFCVDATVRSTVADDHHVVVAGDAHTLADRPHLDAPAVITHHHFVWSGLITNRSVRIASTRDLLGS